MPSWTETADKLEAISIRQDRDTLRIENDRLKRVLQRIANLPKYEKEEDKNKTTLVGKAQRLAQAALRSNH